MHLLLVKLLKYFLMIMMLQDSLKQVVELLTPGPDHL